VAQVINELEAQGLLMLFDQEDKVVKRLTGDLIAAGVVQDPIEPVAPAHTEPVHAPLDS